MQSIDVPKPTFKKVVKRETRCLFFPGTRHPFYGGLLTITHKDNATNVLVHQFDTKRFDTLTKTDIKDAGWKSRKTLLSFLKDINPYFTPSEPVTILHWT